MGKNLQYAVHSISTLWGGMAPVPLGLQEVLYSHHQHSRANYDGVQIHTAPTSTLQTPELSSRITPKHIHTSLRQFRNFFQCT